MELNKQSLKNMLSDFQKKLPFRLGSIAYQNFARYLNL